MKKNELEKIRANSDMGDPNVWKVEHLCDNCKNRDGGGCDVFSAVEDPDEAFLLETEVIHHAQSTGECMYYSKKT